MGYDYLMVKETLRAFIVGGLSAAAVGLMPRCAAGGGAADGVVWAARVSFSFILEGCFLSIDLP